MPQNGEINIKFGVYRSLCCGVEIVVTVGVQFPDCPNHSNLTTIWKGVDDDRVPRALDLPSSKKKVGDSAA
jgi:hypothetical protein